MPVVSVQDVQHVAVLARLRPEDRELATFAAQLNEILGYVRQLQAVSTDSVKPTSHVLALSNVTRPDEPTPSIPPEAALAIAPARHRQLFKVPKIID